MENGERERMYVICKICGTEEKKWSPQKTDILELKNVAA
jgi:hypothetical protein